MWWEEHSICFRDTACWIASFLAYLESYQRSRWRLYSKNQFHLPWPVVGAKNWWGSHCAGAPAKGSANMSNLPPKKRNIYLSYRCTYISMCLFRSLICRSSSPVNIPMAGLLSPYLGNVCAPLRSTLGRFSSLIQKDDSKPKKAITHHANHIWQLLV